MNKSTIELNRESNFPFGYGKVYPLTEDSEEVLQALIDWSKYNLEAKIYKHKVRFNYQNDTGEPYDFTGWPKITRTIVTTKCDFVHYLDIYWQ